MVSQKIVIDHPMGLHLRPAGLLGQAASEYKSRIMIRMKDKEANAKSSLSILGISVAQGDEVEFVCSGPDEEEALAEMIDIVKNRLDTEEDF